MFVNTKDFDVMKDDYLEPDMNNEGYVKKLEGKQDPIDNPKCVGQVKTIIKYNYENTKPVSKLLLVNLIN